MLSRVLQARDCILPPVDAHLQVIALIRCPSIFRVSQTVSVEGSFSDLDFGTNEDNWDGLPGSISHPLEYLIPIVQVPIKRLLY